MFPDDPTKSKIALTRPASNETKLVNNPPKPRMLNKMPPTAMIKLKTAFWRLVTLKPKMPNTDETVFTMTLAGSVAFAGAGLITGFWVIKSWELAAT